MRVLAAPSAQKTRRIATSSAMTVACLVAVALFTMPAQSADAAVPTSVVIDGVLSGTGGGPVADGTYKITFALYAAASGGSPAWKEGPVNVAIKGGRFSYPLGATKAITAAALGNLKTAWLGMKIDADSELPRRPLRSVPYASIAQAANSLACSGCIGAKNVANGAIAAAKVGFAYAGSITKGGPAANLACTGCVSVKEMKFDGDVNLGSHTLTAAKVTSTSDVIAKGTIAAKQFIGDGSKLTGIKTPSGACAKAGEVVKGIKADGSLICVKAMDPKALPGDGIDEISNGLINNQFQNTDCGTANVGIPDNNPVGVADTLTFGDYGLAQKINVSLHLTNSDLKSVIVKLYDPNNKEYVLFNKGKSGTVINTLYPSTTKPVSGDLNTWVNKNPKGKWRLLVSDGSFKDNKIDGAIVKWCINIQTLSSKKIQVKGDLIVDGTMSFGKGGKVDGVVNFEQPVVFKDKVTFENKWCPTQPNGQKSLVIGGVCTPGIATYRTWSQAVEYCRAKRADLCSDAHALVLRRHGYIGDYTNYGNWTNSYADNDSGVHNEATGNVGDDHGTGSRYGAPCCYHSTPPRSTDQIVKMKASDKGIRVVHIHNVADTSFQYAAAFCSRLNADVCNKSEYVYIRSAGKITVAPLWPNDGQDTDGASEYGTSGHKSNMANDVHFYYPYGFACCASTRKTTACPAGTKDTKGVCWLKVNNSGSNWINAARDCGSLGGHVCTVSQSSVLRKAGIITKSGNWSAGFNDCDGQCSGSDGIGNASNNLNPNSNYGYACCVR